MSYQDFLTKFSTTYPEYLANNTGQVSPFNYKYIYPNYFVVLEKLKDTRHNEKRIGIVDANYAQFRANKFVTELILNMVTFKQVNSATAYYFGEKTLYKVGKVVVPNSYDENIENVDSFGISYFKSLEAVFNYGCVTAEFELAQPSPIKNWHPNGSLEFEGQHINGQWCGACVWYHNRKTKDCPLVVSKTGSYNMNSSGKSCTVGTWRTFYETGKPCTIKTFDNDGVLNGYCAEYDETGQIKEYEYCSKRGKKSFVIS